MTHDRVSRRTLLTSAACGLFATLAPAGAAEKHGHRPKPRAIAPTDEARPKTTPLAFPTVVEAHPGEAIELVAQPATHAFLDGRPVPVIGYGGTYMGPAIRLKRGTTTTVRLVNRLDRPTNLHWHGLLVDGRFDGGTSPAIAPGGTWEATLAVDQPGATLWYHAHVHGSTARDVHDGLAGLLIVDDGADDRLGLPSTWGVDDLPLVLQDRTFDADGRPVLPPLAASAEHGFRGATMIVNGTADASARVPSRLVRLRLLNAAGARTFRLCFEDRRAFHLIATDAGLLPAPIELTGLPLAPGERAEILVDFAEGASALTTMPDEHEHRVGLDVATLPDVFAAPVRVLAFDLVRDERPTARRPAELVPLAALPTSTAGLKRRRFELRVGPTAVAAGEDHAAMAARSMNHADMAADHAAMSMDHASMDHAAMNRAAGHDHAATTAMPRLTINGHTFAMGRIDERVPFGATEIWEIVSPDMAHPFHVHGAHFRVLSQDGNRPRAWNGGLKDTVLVENSAELLVTFSRRAGDDAPFVYHCHLLEHEDGGMMGAFTVA